MKGEKGEGWEKNTREIVFWLRPLMMSCLLAVVQNNAFHIERYSYNKAVILKAKSFYAL